MKDFLTSKKGIIIIVVAVILVVGLVIGIIAVTNKPDKNSNGEPSREFEMFDDDDIEEESEDALEVADPEDESQDMQEGGMDFPNDIYDDYVPDNNPSDDKPSENPDDATPENPDDTTTDKPDDGTTEDPDSGLDEGTDSTPGWGWIF